jgi:UDP-N-acetylglucosamine 2-epimerase
VETDQIVADAKALLEDPAVYASMAKAVNPYGDGHACARITQAILYHFGLAAQPPEDFVPP